MEDFEVLAAEYDGLRLYRAGIPNFKANFTRDSVITALLSRNGGMLEDQLAFCAYKQGRKRDWMNGEEPGKIFHEYPGFRMGRYTTEYNACDTTALFLIGHQAYREWSNDDKFASKYRKSIEKAAAYIMSHLKGNMFIEDPAFCGARRFALKVTYWKDSGMRGRRGMQPRYPVVYTLAHIQNIAGLHSAALLLKRKNLDGTALRMKKTMMSELYDKKSGLFVMARDRLGSIKGLSSDQLHALFYLEPGDVPAGVIERIVEACGELETPIGYKVLAGVSEDSKADAYHTKTVWPYEQAIIHAGAYRHRMWAESLGYASLAKKFSRVESVSRRVIKRMGRGAPEIFVMENGWIKRGGCDPQLWSVGAKVYFNSLRT